MSRTRRSSAIGSALLLFALASSLVASPASAAGKTRFVDDDGKAGPTSCSGSRTAYKSIQKAINASGAGDTVKVCPGTYVGPVTIKGARTGLVLRSVTTHGATIKAVDEFDAGTTYLVKVDDVDDVTVKGFKIRPLQPSSHSYCSASTGIWARSAQSLNLSDNDIRPTGTGQFCGLYDGILASLGSTGSIARNTIKDYRDNGIAITGVGTHVTVRDNTVTFAHVHFPLATAQAAILLDDANGTVRDNVLHGPAAGGSNPSQPEAGVELLGSGASTSVHDNTIARFASDIRIVHVNGGRVYRNTMTGGQVGIDLLDGDQMAIDGNDSSAATVHGLYVAGPSTGAAASDASKSTGDNVHDNDFRTDSNGSAADCKGESSATTTTNGNTFSDNLGNTSSPAALCRGGDVPG